MASPHRSPVLQQAYAIQAQARDLMTKKSAGEPLPDAQVCAWMDNRRDLAAADLATPLDALAVAHGLLQGVECLHRFADDPETLRYVVGEVALAASGIIEFLEEAAGVTREALGLFDDYGPVWN